MAEEIKYRVRIAGKDLDGTKPVKQVLPGVRGIGVSFSNVILKSLNINPTQKMGTLKDEEIKRIESFLEDPLKLNIPKWLLNRRNDRITGKTQHLVGAELQLTQSKDIETLTSMKSRRGLRHAFGLKVRGQETKSRGRGGRAVGVSRKSLKTTR